MGVAGMIITSDEMDHSRKFPAKLGTSKMARTEKPCYGYPLVI